MQEITNFVTSDLLKDFGSLCLLVALVVQFTKDAFDSLFRFFNIALQTKYVVYFWSIIILTISEWYSGTLSNPERWPLILLSGIVVSLTTMKTYETLKTSK